MKYFYCEKNYRHTWERIWKCGYVKFKTVHMSSIDVAIMNVSSFDKISRTCIWTGRRPPDTRRIIKVVLGLWQHRRLKCRCGVFIGYLTILFSRWVATYLFHRDLHPSIALRLAKESLNWFWQRKKRSCSGIQWYHYIIYIYTFTLLYLHPNYNVINAFFFFFIISFRIFYIHKVYLIRSMFEIKSTVIYKSS